MTSGGYWPPSSKVEIADFEGGRIVLPRLLRDVFFASNFLAYVEPNLFFSLSGGKILQCSP